MVIAEESKKVLSICIPTYNRINKTSELVHNILLYKGNDIEVIVLDNCSFDDTENILSSIDDKRFSYIRNESNIGSMPNVLKSMTFGTGKFVMLCLDKDFIRAENLPLFINKLKSYQEISVGYCALNYDTFEGDNNFKRGLESLLKLAYISSHPSGLFLRRDVLGDKCIIDKILNNNKTFAFNTELLKAEMCVLGNSTKVNIPLVFTEKLEDCKEVMSHTYKGDNIYFFPDNIKKTFIIYVENLLNLDISKFEKRIVLKRIFSSLFIASTFGFKEIMKNNSICAHHGISTRNVTRKEIFKNALSFSNLFRLSNFQINVFHKINIWIYANLKLIYIVCMTNLKKN